MADVSQLKFSNDSTIYDIRDANAVHDVDNAMSTSSTNPVQNKIVTSAVEEVNKKGIIVTNGEIRFG